MMLVQQMQPIGNGTEDGGKHMASVIGYPFTDYESTTVWVSMTEMGDGPGAPWADQLP